MITYVFPSHLPTKIQTIENDLHKNVDEIEIVPILNTQLQHSYNYDAI